ncbi:MAG: hypothetical protein R3B84_07415 [Zavarzinella sp.]
MMRFLSAIIFLLPTVICAQSSEGNPAVELQVKWVNQLPWKTVISIDKATGRNWDEKLKSSQALLAKKGGGIIYFPAGTYEFSDSIFLEDGIILRGDPGDSSDPKEDRFTPKTRFEFPKFRFSAEGNGTSRETAFKAISLADPATASNCGIVSICLNRAHIDFESGPEYKAGKNRLVFGCELRNTATADPAVPNRDVGQQPWQIFTQRHTPAIRVNVQENSLVANNRIPKSGQDNFLQKNYVLVRGGKTKEKTTVEEGVEFDYDNRPGIYCNDYGLGAAGGQYPDGSPTAQPHGFRKGIIIRNNFIFATGRCAISFTGDGTICSHNTIRFQKDVWRPTNTGIQLTTGASTNDNRAVQMRGYRWVVENNDYEVYRNLCYDRKYYINDGEGLMHEDHVNSTVLDSKLLNNRGNTYISIYHTGGINGLEIRGNQIRTAGGISAIYVVANKQRDTKKHECRNVTVIDNITSGSGITITGDPSSNNLIRNNRHEGAGGTILNRANARLENNRNYQVKE